MAAIRTEGDIMEISGHTLVPLPKAASAKLPSRGVTMVKGRIGTVAFTSALEPDGKGSHWLALDDALLTSLGAGVGESVTLEFSPADEWPEPEVPDDIMAALKASPDAMAGWRATTPLARWDWIRWMRATANPKTREKRIRTATDMLEGGKRRPCCFDRSQCTVPEVSKSGKLMTDVD